MSREPIEISSEAALKLFLDNIGYCILIEKSGEQVLDAFVEEAGEGKEALEWVQKVMENAEQKILDENKRTALELQYRENTKIQEVLIKHMVTNKDFWNKMNEKRIDHEKVHNIPVEQQEDLNKVVVMISKPMQEALKNLGYQESELKSEFDKNIIPFLKELCNSKQFTKQDAHSGVTVDDIGTLNQLLMELKNLGEKLSYKKLLEQLQNDKDAELMTAIVHMAARRSGQRHVAAKAVETKMAEMKVSSEPNISTAAQVISATRDPQPVIKDPVAREGITAKIEEAKRKQEKTKDQQAEEQKRYAEAAAERVKNQKNSQLSEQQPQPGLRNEYKKVPPPPPPINKHEKTQANLDMPPNVAEIQAKLDAHNTAAIKAQLAEPVIFNVYKSAEAIQKKHEIMDLADSVWKQEEKILRLCDLIDSEKEFTENDLIADLSDIQFPQGISDEATKARERREELAKEEDLNEQAEENMVAINSLIQKLREREALKKLQGSEIPQEVSEKTKGGQKSQEKDKVSMSPEREKLQKICELIEDLYSNNLEYLNKYNKISEHQKPEKEAHRGYWLRANTNNKLKHADDRRSTLEDLIQKSIKIPSIQIELQQLNEDLIKGLNQIIEEGLKNDLKDQGWFSSKGEVYTMLTEAKASLIKLDSSTPALKKKP